MTPNSVAEIFRRFGVTYCLKLPIGYSSDVVAFFVGFDTARRKIKTLRSSKTFDTVSTRLHNMCFIMVATVHVSVSVVIGVAVCSSPACVPNLI